MILEVEEVHVRRRIEAAQRAIQRKRRRVEAARGALRDLHLHAVAGIDVLLGAAHRLEESLLAERALDRGSLGRGGFGREREHQAFGQRRREPRTQPLEALARGLVRIGLPRIGVDDEVELAEHVVHHRQLVRHQEQHVGRSQRVGLAAGERGRLDMLHRLVAEVADEPPAEAQRRRNGGHAIALQIVAHVLEWVGVLEALEAHVRAARVAHKAAHDSAARLDALRAREADERIAPEALAADHRLEQIGKWAVRELGVYRERRVQVGARLGDHRDARVTLRSELGEIELGHGNLHLMPTELKLAAGASRAARAARGRVRI